MEQSKEELEGNLEWAKNHNTPEKVCKTCKGERRVMHRPPGLHPSVLNCCMVPCPECCNPFEGIELP